MTIKKFNLFALIIVTHRMLSHFIRVQLFATLCTGTHQAPLSMQEYWSELPYAPPGDLPDLGIKPAFPALQADSLPLNHWGRLLNLNVHFP